jgi:alkylation response protein AidB-like acyl-CoA dehydrogenase
MIADRPVSTTLIGKTSVGKAKVGGSFLIEQTPANETHTPEDFSSDVRDIYAAVDEFVKARVLPNVEHLEGHHDNVMLKKLLHECGEQGFFQVEVPEAFGGLDMSKTTATYVGEALAKGGGFAVTFGAHASIGMLPLVYFGSDALKAKYLEKMAAGQIIGAYCLSEPGSGSDAQAAKTRAVPSADGSSYTVSGTKMWITNGGIADMFTVFCQVITPEGPKFSCFMIERDSPGVSLGKEEDKMGIRLSSTTQVILEDVVVPAENLLGEVGGGAKIAFNILNIGRYKLGSGGIGGSKAVLEASAKYAKERVSFGQPIGNFGAIKEKLGEMTAQIYAAESVTYRVTGMIDEAASHATDARGKLKAIEIFRIEASIVKVFGTEVLAYCTDEAVQVFGGYGFSEEYPVARAYRDARINRIFEGTNEINRMLIPGELLKMAMKGELPLLQAAQKLQAEILEPSFDGDEDDSVLASEVKAVENLKKLALQIAGQAAMKYMQNLSQQQELMMRVADIIIQAFAAESCVLRTQKVMVSGPTSGLGDSSVHLAATQLFVGQAVEICGRSGREALSAFLEGDDLRMNLAALRRFTKYEPRNNIALRRSIAERVLEADGYPIKA